MQDDTSLTADKSAKAHRAQNMKIVKAQQDDAWDDKKSGRYALSDDSDVSETDEGKKDSCQEEDDSEEDDSEGDDSEEDDASEDSESFSESSSVEEENTDDNSECDADPDSEELEELDRFCSSEPIRRYSHGMDNDVEISDVSGIDEEDSDGQIEAESVASEHDTPYTLGGTSDSQQEDVFESETRASADAQDRTFLGQTAGTANIAMRMVGPAHALGRTRPKVGSMGKAGIPFGSNPSGLVPGAEMKVASGRTRPHLKIWKGSSRARNDTHVSSDADGDKTLVDARPEKSASGPTFDEREPTLTQHPADFKLPAVEEYINAPMPISTRLLRATRILKSSAALKPATLPTSIQTLDATRVESSSVEATPQGPGDRGALNSPTRDDPAPPASEKPATAQPECPGTDVCSDGAEARAGSKRKLADEVEQDVSGTDEHFTTPEVEGAAAIDPAIDRPNKRLRLSTRAAEVAMAACGGAVVGAVVGGAV